MQQNFFCKTFPYSASSPVRRKTNAIFPSFSCFPLEVRGICDVIRTYVRDQANNYGANFLGLLNLQRHLDRLNCYIGWPSIFRWKLEARMSHHADHVPVKTKGSGTWYNGAVWYEPISSLKSVNGIAVEDLEVELERSQLKHGDKVTLEFDGKMFSGVIESASLPDSPRKEHPSSPTHSSTGIVREETVTVAKLQGRKRKSVTVERFEEISFPEPKRQKKFVEKNKGASVYMYILIM